MREHEGSTKYSPSSGPILVVEDDETIGRLLETILSEVGLAVRLVRTPHAALAVAEEEPPRLVLLDLGLPGLYGTSLAVTLRTRWPGLPLVIISALPTQTVAQDAWACGAAAYFTKPFDCDEVVAGVRRILAAPRRIPLRSGTSLGRPNSKHELLSA